MLIICFALNSPQTNLMKEIDMFNVLLAVHNNISV
jgi:hypothetical protein